MLRALRDYVILYRDSSLLPLDLPYAFVCKSVNRFCAERQCENANPHCEVVWSWEGMGTPNDVHDAYDDWNLGAD